MRFYDGTTLATATVDKTIFNREDIRYIVLHHTATDNSTSAEDVLKSMINRYCWQVQQSWTWGNSSTKLNCVPTHYIIDKNGTVLNPTPITQPAGWFSTKNWWLTLDEAITLNWQSIHIEVVGSRTDTETPADMSQAQADALVNLVDELTNKFSNPIVTAHSLIDKNKWTCWKAVLLRYWQEKEKDKHKRIKFKLSRYYSVMPNQERYYANRTYEEDFKINCSGDPLTTADGHQLKSEEAGHVVACPKEYPLWTKFYVEWVWEVICHDRGWAIVKQWEVVRLDIWSGIWDQWRINIETNKIPTWERMWYVIN